MIDFPSVDRFSANSDFELKLVTIWSLGMGSVPSKNPSLVILSRKIGEVTPKLPSGPSLLNTVGYVPSATAVPQVTFTFAVPPASNGTRTVPATQPGGNVWPTVTVAAFPAYTLRLSTSVSGMNRKKSSSAATPGAKIPAVNMDNAVVARTPAMNVVFNWMASDR